MPKYLALDTETTGLNLHTGDQPFFISTCDEQGNTRYWRFRVDPFTRRVECSDEQRQAITDYISRYVLVFHNCKFDVRALSTIGITFNWELGFEETLLASHAVSSSDRHGLKELAIKYLEFSDADEKLLKSTVTKARNTARRLGWTLSDHPAADYWIPGQLDENDRSCETYACQDAERTMLLWQLYEPLLDTLDLRAGYEQEKRLLRVVYRMESDGITINTRRLNEIQSFLLQETEDCEAILKDEAKAMGYKNLNLDSGSQVANILHSKKHFNLPVIKTTEKGQISTDKDSLSKLYRITDKGTSEYNFLRQMLLRRTFLSGIRYLEGYKKNCYRFHRDWAILFCSLNQTGTQTSRFSSSNPNGQNVSKKAEAKLKWGDITEKFEIPKLREVFGPIPGKTWYAIDYSQLELRVFAAVSQEQGLIDALNAGYDFHGYVASRIFNKPMDEITDMERTIAKNTNFALIFGASPRKVNETAGIPNAYELFAGQFPYATEFMQKTIREVKKTGYVRTVDGYRLDIPLQAPYKAVNYLVQGTAGRIVKNAMVKIDSEDWFNWENIRLVLQIHDELIIESDTNCEFNSPAYINRIMELMRESGRDMGIDTPADCDIITTDWGHGEKIEVTPTEFNIAA
jgi:DNA polymerase-1